MKKSFILHDALDGAPILVAKNSLDYAYAGSNGEIIAVILSDSFLVKESLKEIADKLEEMED